MEYIASLTGMVIYSMSDALQPAISYCFGAGLLPRMRKMQRVVMSAAAILVPIWQLDGVWVLNFVSSVFSVVVAVVIAKKGIETNRSLAAKTNNSEAK